jgi:hypothetical protein
MEGMDPNNPPPKETRVVLKRWEYTDPVGVPHPDVVDVVAQIRNDSGHDTEGIILEVEIQWFEGALSKKTSATWGEKMLLSKPPPIRLAPGGTKIIRMPVDMAAKMASLAPAHRWPWSLRVLMTARVAGITVASRQMELLINPAD